MAVAEETVDQSADEQFFHTYGYYPTAYTYSAPVAVKTVKYAAPTVKYVAPTVKTVQYAAPYAYQYGAYPYAAAYQHQPYAFRSLRKSISISSLCNVKLGWISIKHTNEYCYDFEVTSQIY